MSPDPAARPRASVFGALVEGWRRVLRAPALALGLPVAILVAAALPALAARAATDGPSIRGGFETAAASELTIVTNTAAGSISREVMGLGGTLLLADEWSRRPQLGPAMRVAVLVAIALWLWAAGGAIDRLARGRRVGLAHFASVSSVFFVRFLRLSVPIGVAIWGIHAWLVPWMRADVSDAARLAIHAACIGALAGIAIIADVAQVRAVVEDRRSMIGALLASIRFIRRRVLRVLALYVLNAAVFAVLLVLWRAVPFGEDIATSMFAGAGLALLYLVFRVVPSLALIGSLTVFFQGELAHARYTASPQLVWPDSPAAEAINNLRSDDSR
jgi:hypothetical protein